MEWFRWYHGTVKDPKFRTISRRSGQPLTAVLAVWAAMLECASEARERGFLEGWADEDMAYLLDLNEHDITAIRQAMQDKTLDGPRLTGWEKRNPTVEDPTAAARKRRQRAREKAQKAQEDAGEDKVLPPEQSRAKKPPIAVTCHALSPTVTVGHDREDKRREERLETDKRREEQKKAEHKTLKKKLPQPATREKNKSKTNNENLKSEQDHALAEIFAAAALDLGDLRSPRNQAIAERWLAAGRPLPLILQVISNLRHRQQSQGNSIPLSLNYYDDALQEAMDAAAQTPHAAAFSPRPLGAPQDDAQSPRPRRDRADLSSTPLKGPAAIAAAADQLAQSLSERNLTGSAPESIWPERPA